MWPCAGLRARVQVHVHVGARAHIWRRDSGLGGQPCREPMVAVPLGSPWEKNSLKPGTPLKSPQSPQVWLAYLVSSSSWKEVTCQMPGPPGTPRMEGQRCGRVTARGGAGASRSGGGRGPAPGPREAVSPGSALTGRGPSSPRLPSPPHPEHPFPLGRPSPTGGRPHLPQTHQEAVVPVPHEDEAQPGHHLQAGPRAGRVT